MQRLLSFSWKAIGTVAGVGLIGAGVLSMRCEPIKQPEASQKNEGYLRGQLHYLDLRFMHSYNRRLPAVDVRVNDNIHCVSFDFATAKPLDHLQLFNKMLEVYHLYKNSKTFEIEKTSRKFNGDVVIYSLTYRFKNKGKLKTTVYLIGDTKTNKYRMTVEKDERFSDMELILIFNIGKLISGYELHNTAGELTQRDYTSSVAEFVSSLGCEMVETEKNNFDMKKCLEAADIKKNIVEIMKTKSKDDSRA
eukprot:TRINITY_DN14400_c0_g3_i2.p1 TRINITY_DN14400_c0_g3~~TRINITY_DN14400_c0_g3_i2.p1  ORF type:complete len:249 (-),score=74.77 TRINITY_DN14400_c0_g3_i2:748-1494(-)